MFNVASFKKVIWLLHMAEYKEPGKGRLSLRHSSSKFAAVSSSVAFPPSLSKDEPLVLKVTFCSLISLFSYIH